MVQIVQDIWWHIDEIYYPKKCKRYRQIVQFFTDERTSNLNFTNKYFFGLKVYGRNSSRKEVTFYEKTMGGEYYIVLNLDLDSFPLVPHEIYENSNYHDVKLEIEYFTWDDENNLDKSITRFQRITVYFIPSRLNEHEFSGKLHPEFTIKLPLGWKLEDSKKSEVILVISGIDEQKGQYFCEVLPLEVVSVIHEGGHRVYNCLSLNFETINEKYSNSNNHSFIANLYYNSRITRYSLFISLVPLAIGASSFLTILYGFICWFFEDWHFKIVEAIGTGFCIIILSFVYFYISLMKEGYHFDHSKRDFWLVSISLGFWILFLIKPIWEQILLNLEII